MKFAPIAIPAMALLQQHDARRDTLIEPAARRRAAIEARGHSELGHWELGARSGRKNQPANCFSLLLQRRTVKLFRGLLGKYLLVSELHNAHIIRRVFLTTIISG